MSDRAVLLRAFRELLPHKGRLAVSVVSVLIRSSLFMVPPLLTRRIVDDALNRQDLPALWRLSLAAIGVTVVAVSLILADLWASSYVQHVSAGVRTRLFGNLLGRPLAFFRQTKTGDLLARLLQDSQSFTDLFFNSYGGGVFGTATWAVTIGAVGLGAMLWLDPVLTLLCLLFYGLQLLAMRYVAPRSREAGRQLAESRAALTETVRETVTGMGYVKAAGMEGVLTERFEAKLTDMERAQLRSIGLGRLLRMAEAVPEVLGTALLYLAGSYRIWQGELTVGGLVAFAAYLWWLHGPVSVLSELYVQQIKRLLPGVERTFSFLDQPLAPELGRERPEVCQGALALEQVTFGYDPERPVLQELSLTVAPGEVVAVVGPSGSGKSTLADLLLGLQRPQSGRILLDGRDIGALDPAWLRRQVGTVPQENTVLNETLAANVAYGRPDAPPAAVEEACRDGLVAEFAAHLEGGLAARVGERGAQLSGGQRQRVGIARAILYDPAVLILDEATSALDGAAEAAVMAGVRSRFAGRTLVIIAHRLSTVAEADRIYVLDQGRVARAGTHRDLLASDGAYRRLYEAEAAQSVNARSAPSVSP